MVLATIPNSRLVDGTKMTNVPANTIASLAAKADLDVNSEVAQLPAGAAAATAGAVLQQDGTWAAMPGGGDALTTNPLSQFAATTSAQLAGVMSDETGTGSLVFSSSPVFTTPNIGNATGNITGNAATVTTNANLTGAVTSAGNTTSLGAFTTAQLNTAISDGTVATGGGTATGTNTGDQTTITGNAGTATALQTARTIAGVSFNGTANIAIASTNLSDTTSIVLLASTQTLTNKTLTDPKITSGLNSQIGTTYTFVLTDATKIVEMSNAAANTVTIPANATVAFPIGTTITVVQTGAGLTTVQGAVGVTVNGVSAGSKATTAQYEGMSLYKRATDEWVIVNK